ncbi:MAG: isoprenylcysteine carboxylmethyltransferase family protein, partial [Bacteroidota bacterium]
VRGPYRCVRNPMAVGGLSQGLAVGLWLGAWSVFAYVVAGGLLWHVFVRPIEEADLAARFGSRYEAYRRRVRCWIPGWLSVG